jgi:hypothetical protein
MARPPKQHSAATAAARNMASDQPGMQQTPTCAAERARTATRSSATSSANQLLGAQAEFEVSFSCAENCNAPPRLSGACIKCQMIKSGLPQSDLAEMHKMHKMLQQPKKPSRGETPEAPQSTAGQSDANGNTQ